MSSTPFGVRIPDALQAAVRRYALEQGRPLGEIVQDALQSYLSTQGAAIASTQPVRLPVGRRKRLPWSDDEVVVLDDQLSPVESL